MNDVVLASTEVDAAAVAAVEQHHAEMASVLAALVETLVALASHRDAEVALAARDDLTRWCHSDLAPHAIAEEQTLYPAARDREGGRLLVDGMRAEHAALLSLIDEVAGTDDTVRAAAAAKALQVVFENRLRKENELLLPLLAGAADVSLAELLEGMNEPAADQQGERADRQQPGCDGHSCGCREADGPGYPELDARGVPHAIRHATIFGALEAVRPGSGLLLVAPHDPIPLLNQIEQRWPGVFDVDYLDRGPEAWRLSFSRRDRF